jgi:ABC-type sugar transport system ATPase subunit
VTIRGLSKKFSDATIYDNFDFDIPRGKLMSVFGPNGCGKSTLINMIAGLFPADSGEILFDGQPLDKIKFGYVFQNYREAVFPWLSAFDNIAYPLKVMGVPKADRIVRVEKIVANLNVKIDLKLYSCASSFSPCSRRPTPPRCWCRTTSRRRCTCPTVSCCCRAIRRGPWSSCTTTRHGRAPTRP